MEIINIGLVLFIHFGNLLQNTNITVGNTTVISKSIKDNPDLHFYTTVYGSLIGVIFVFTALRAFVFMKVNILL